MRSCREAEGPTVYMKSRLIILYQNGYAHESRFLLKSDEREGGFLRTSRSGVAVSMQS